MKLAIISLFGPSSNDIAEKTKKYFSEVNHLNLRKMEVHAEKDLKVLYQGKLIKDYDCVYIRGSYKYANLQRSIARAIYQKCYQPMHPKAFTLAHNKFLTILEMQKKQVPIPKTCLAASEQEAKKSLKNLKFPIIIKTPAGTQGRGVMFADSESAAKSLIDALETFKQPYILQEYIETNATDVRAIVLKDKVIASMKRKGNIDEARANIHAGGKGQPYELDIDTEKIAIRAAKAIGSEVCAVDILESGKPYVIEVNLSPGLQISDIVKKDVADEIAKFLAQQTREFLKARKSTDYKKIITDIEAESKNANTKKIITNLDIKAGIIKLPRITTKISGFDIDDEVTITAKKDKIIIKKHHITDSQEEE